MYKFNDKFIHSGLCAHRQAHIPELFKGLSEHKKAFRLIAYITCCICESQHSGKQQQAQGHDRHTGNKAIYGKMMLAIFLCCRKQFVK